MNGRNKSNFKKRLEDAQKEEQQKKDIERENKLKKEKEERERKEKEERQRKEKEEQLRQEEEERKKVEAAQRAAELEAKRKQEAERQQATKLAQALSKDLIDVDELDEEEDGPLNKIKQEKHDATDSNESELCKIYDVNKQDYRIATKNFELNQQIETYLQEVGTLNVHPDVIYALQHIKDLGAKMRKQNQSQSQSTDNVLLRNLFPERQETQHVDTSDTIASQIKQENGSSVLTSPPARTMFLGLNRHTPETFSEVVSSKKRKGSTPLRKAMSPVTSPQRPASSIEARVAKLDIVCKTVDVGTTFLKKKKLTASNANLVYDAIKEQYKRDIVEFTETHQSFFKIMTHYVASLGLVPEDVRHMERKQRLFEFIVKNIEYTKVNLIITYPLFFQYFIRNLLISERLAGKWVLI